MGFSSISLILTIGIFQGIVVAVSLVLPRSGKLLHNRVLATFFVALSFTLIPTLLGQLNLIEGHQFLYFLPLDFKLFLFPLLFLYSHTILSSSVSLKRILFHLSPGIVLWCYLAFVWILTLGSQNKVLTATEAFFFEIQLVSQLLWAGIIFYYSLAIFKLLKETLKLKLSKSQKSFIPWLKGLCTIFIVVGSMELVALFVGKYYGYWKGSPIDEWMGFSFALAIKCIYASVLYIVAFVGYSKFRKVSYSVPRIQSEGDLLTNITAAMETDKHYLNPNFSLSDLAEMTNTPVAYVSSLLNNELNLSFNDFVNQYRVETVKEKLLTDAPDKYTLQYIAEEAGFNSKTTFYRAFQKFTGQSPSAYLREKRK